MILKIMEYQQYKKIEKLPNTIKLLLEKRKIINEEYNNKLIFFINDCLDIENNNKNTIYI